MPILDPGTFTIECDHCDATIECDTTEIANGGVISAFTVDDQTLFDADWFIDDGSISCPECHQSIMDENQ